MGTPTIKRAVLNRYTTFPVLLDMLQRKKLVLLSPKSWEDRNDAEIILKYQEKKAITSILSLCFSQGDETVHHWKTFSNGPSGCCIEFNKTKLFQILNKVPGLIHGSVAYRRLAEIQKNKVPIEYIPFTKRWAYRVEEEYRLIYETDQAMDFFEIEIPLSIINRVTISQHMPKQIFNTIKQYLKKASGNPDSKVYKSTLYENTRWINAFK